MSVLFEGAKRPPWITLSDRSNSSLAKRCSSVYMRFTKEIPYSILGIVGNNIELGSVRHNLKFGSVVHNLKFGSGGHNLKLASVGHNLKLGECRT